MPMAFVGGGALVLPRRYASKCGRPAVGRVHMAAEPRASVPDEGLVRPLINWYPGHIAKAERKLREMLQLVDVVIEMRDCRIPASTAHPLVADWVAKRPKIVAMNREDMVPAKAKAEWRRALETEDNKVFFINAKQGTGVQHLRRAALQSGDWINDKRRRRGLLPRPVRAMVLGFPNVGKSALINRLCSRRAAKSENRPGVTRSMQWVRVADDLELLDTPGIIPMKLVTQVAASRLAVCDDIGEASYDNQLVAAFLAEELRTVARSQPGYVDLELIEKRFGVTMGDMRGDEYLVQVADKGYKSDVERVSRKFLHDFRNGHLGLLALEAPRPAKK